jgi:hypothetical protein
MPVVSALEKLLYYLPFTQLSLWHQMICRLWLLVSLSISLSTDRLLCVGWFWSGCSVLWVLAVVVSMREHCFCLFLLHFQRPSVGL